MTTPRKVLFKTGWLPIVVVSAAGYGVWTGDTFWRAVCLGILGGVAIAAWWTLNLTSFVQHTGWREVAEQATRGIVVTSAYTASVENVLDTAIEYIEMEDPATAANLRRELLDAGARFTEHAEL